MNQQALNPEELLARYCAGNTELLQLLLHHSRAVADRALRIAHRHPEWQLDLRFVHEAAMLHDIGVVYTAAERIHCLGRHPYLIHGMLGGNILRHEGLPRHARVAERHTGTGLKASVIRERALPLPQMDWLPVTMEEKLVCYADKFYSKAHPEAEKTHEQVLASLAKFGPADVEIFGEWMELFE